MIVLLFSTCRVCQPITLVAVSESPKNCQNFSAAYQKLFCSLLNSQAKRVLYLSMLSVGVVTTSGIAGVVEIC